MGSHRWRIAMSLALGIALGVTGRSAPALPAGPSAMTPIEEAGWVPIGGMRQWVTISGKDRGNPIVLFVHGGPGNPLSPYSEGIYGGWTADFTIVHWDQRGAGRTFEANPETGETALTIDRLAQDGIEVAEYVTHRLGKKKALLVGGSWGSALAVHMIARRPDLFEAYVGVSQLVEERTNQAATLKHLRVLAMAANDKATLEAIDELGPPPWTDARNFGRLRRLTRAYEAKATDPAPRSWWIPAAAYSTPAYEKAYEAGEEYSYLQFVGPKGGGMISAIDLSKVGRKFDVPVYLVQGADDLVTVPEVSRAWFDSIDAPRKQYVLVPRSGHDPNQGLVNATYDILKAVPPGDRALGPIPGTEASAGH